MSDLLHRNTGIGCNNKVLLEPRIIKSRFGPQPDTILYADSYETLRYQFQNIRGFRWTIATDRINNGEQFKIARSNGTTVLRYTETNTEWDCEGGRPRKMLQQQMAGAYNHAICAYSKSRLKQDSFWKPGRTMTEVCNPWNGHVIDKGADNRMGNWSYITMRGKKKKHLTFITVYKISDITLAEPCIEALTGARDSMKVFTHQTQILREEGKKPLMSFICASVVNHDITKVMGQ
jgi:hypothetical protein